VEIREFQKLIKKIYYKKDKKRGVEGSFRWLVEEVGELARCLRKIKYPTPGGLKGKNRQELKEEFADLLAWLVSLASLVGLDLEEAAKKYKNGCPRCQKKRCICKE